MSTRQEDSTRPSRRSPRPRRTPSDPSSQPPPALPAHVFAPEYLALLVERDEPDTAGEADTAGPWHVERNPRGGWAVLREGESFDKSTRTIPTGTFERREAALLAAAVLPGTGRRLRYRLGSEPDDSGHPILQDGRIVGHSEFFWENFIASLNTLDALMASPSSTSTRSPSPGSPNGKVDRRGKPDALAWVAGRGPPAFLTWERWRLAGSFLSVGDGRKRHKAKSRRDASAPREKKQLLPSLSVA